MALGITYVGGKSAHAKKIIEKLPPAETFVDLFAGGCSVTHAAILSGKYRRFIVNDINCQITEYFKRLINGEKVTPRWYSRDEYKKTSDMYAKIVFSFAGADKSYAFSDERAEARKAAFDAVFFDEWQDFERLFPEMYEQCRQSAVGDFGHRWRGMEKASHEYIKQLTAEEENALRMKNPDYRAMIDRKNRPGSSYAILNSAITRTLRLMSLSIDGGACIECSNLDYRDVKIPSGSVVYCDPPYQATDQSAYRFMAGRFDSAAFFEWIQGRPNHYFSEFDAPGFQCIAEFKKINGLSASRNHTVTDRLFKA